ncbi:hypothetical protein TNCV_599011 [Trichonephila clavipes]|nr:hypothetical protein TNCV_599011 [Trichonephila clavipes]
MPLRRLRRQYEQLLQYEMWRIIGMMEAGPSACQVARQLGRSDCVDALDRLVVEITATSEEMHTYNPLLHDRHPGTGSTFSVSSRTIRMHLPDGHFGSRCPIRVGSSLG